jgi:hypothetical protein
MQSIDRCASLPRVALTKFSGSDRPRIADFAGSSVHLDLLPCSVHKASLNRQVFVWPLVTGTFESCV